MSNYVDKAVDKNGNVADIHDARFPDGAVPGMVKAQDGKLLVDQVVQPVGPVPVATIDGVDYYHKHEFDLEELAALVATLGNTGIDIITGETKEYGSGHRPYFELTNSYTFIVKFVPNDASSFEIRPFDEYGNVYTSRAYTVVQTQQEVADDTKICLPGCTAYYGFISNDRRTFISYWNEEGEGPVEVDPVTKIKDANNNEVEINDARIPAAGQEGDVLKVGANGLEWGSAGGDIPILDFSANPAPYSGTELFTKLRELGYVENNKVFVNHEMFLLKMQHQYSGVISEQKVIISIKNVFSDNYAGHIIDAFGYITGAQTNKLSFNIIAYFGGTAIDAISFGTTTINTNTLPSTSSALEGDVLKLNDNLEPVWVTPASGGGTKLYLHTLLLDNDGSKTVRVITNSSELFTLEERPDYMGGHNWIIYTGEIIENGSISFENSQYDNTILQISDPNLKRSYWSRMIIANNGTMTITSLFPDVLDDTVTEL